MNTPENYAKYKEIAKPTVEKVAKLGLIFNDIVEREQVIVTDEEIDQQLNILLAQYRQQNLDQNIDLKHAKFEIQNVLLRKKVFDMLASTATISYTGN